MKHLLNDALFEIRDLRRRNEILSAKVEVMDLFALVLNTSPAHRSVGLSPDVAWALQKKIDELTQDEANAHQGQTGGRVDEGKSSANGGKSV